MGFTFIFLTIVFTAYGQLVLKREISSMGAMPIQFSLLIPYLLRAFTNLKIISGVLSAFLAMICWFGAISRLDLSFAYPFMSLTFPVVIILSGVFFNEPLYWTKYLGTIIVIIGLFFIASK